jgi:hypothetical protein
MGNMNAIAAQTRFSVNSSSSLNSSGGLSFNGKQPSTMLKDGYFIVRKKIARMLRISCSIFSLIKCFDPEVTLKLATNQVQNMPDSFSIVSILL